MSYDHQNKMCIPKFGREYDITEKQKACYRKTNADKQDRFLNDIIKGNREFKIESSVKTAQSFVVLHVFDVKDLLKLGLEIKGAQDDIKKLFQNLKSGVVDDVLEVLKRSDDASTKVVSDKLTYTKFASKNTPSSTPTIDKYNEKLINKLGDLICKAKSIKGKLYLHSNNNTFIFKEIGNAQKKVTALLNAKPIQALFLKGGKLLKTGMKYGKTLVKSSALAVVVHSSIAIGELVNKDKKTFGQILGEFSSEMIKLLISVKSAALIVATVAKAAVFVAAGATGALLFVGVTVIIGAVVSHLDKELGLTDKLCNAIDRGIKESREEMVRVINLITEEKEMIESKAASAYVEFERNFNNWVSRGYYY
ncbi:hypothetical protein WJR50_12520 [Catalinimonas sp. 4WD22]|uniref:hypothetical protein n=1 Tax=Catalinimonas locisalis TaxID=3133978 RepID=UPI003101A80E